MGLSSSRPQFEPGKISPLELYNQLQNIRMWTVLLDVRSDLVYEQSHIDGSHNSLESAIKEMNENQRVECQLVIYSSSAGEHVGSNILTSDLSSDVRTSTTESDNHGNGISNILLNECIKFQRSHVKLNSILTLTGGFTKFKELWPFMCTDHPVCSQKGRLYPSRIASSLDMFASDQCLYLSSYALASDPIVLETLQITHVVNVTPDHANADMTQSQASSPVEFHRVPILDEVSSRLIDHLDEVVAFMENACKVGGKILVHCRHGQSRSAAVLCAFLMKTRNWTFSEAISLLVACRPSVRPNQGFQQQLHEWQNTLKFNAIKHNKDNSFTADTGSDATAAAVRDISKKKSVIVYRSPYDKTCPQEAIQMMQSRWLDYQSHQPSTTIMNKDKVVLVLPGSFNPIHRGHLQCLEIAKSHLESKGMFVLGGFIQPSSNFHVQNKLGKEHAMSLEDRIHTSLGAISDHHHEQQQADSKIKDKKDEEVHKEEGVGGNLYTPWISVWGSGDANGVFAAQKCAKYVSEKLHLDSVIPYPVCGGDFAAKMGWGDFKLGCGMVAIAREGTDTPSQPLKNGWHLAACDAISSISSTLVREAIESNDMAKLKDMLHPSVLAHVLYQC